MSEDSPFASFVPSTEVPSPPAAGKPPKKPRKNAKKAAAPAAENPALPKEPKAPKKPRTKRAPKVRAIKIDLALAMTALSGLQEGDAKFVMSVVQALQPFGKKQRVRIIEALGKVFA